MTGLPTAARWHPAASRSTWHCGEMGAAPGSAGPELKCREKSPGHLQALPQEWSREGCPRSWGGISPSRSWARAHEPPHLFRCFLQQPGHRRMWLAWPGGGHSLSSGSGVWSSPTVPPVFCQRSQIPRGAPGTVSKKHLDFPRDAVHPRRRNTPHPSSSSLESLQEQVPPPLLQRTGGPRRLGRCPPLEGQGQGGTRGPDFLCRRQGRVFTKSNLVPW